MIVICGCTFAVVDAVLTAVYCTPDDRLSETLIFFTVLFKTKNCDERFDHAELIFCVKVSVGVEKDSFFSANLFSVLN